MRTWSSAQYEQFKRQERRDRLADQQAEADALADHRKEQEMVHKKTKSGLLAKRPPSIDSADQALDQLHEQIGEALVTAREAGERERTLKSTSPVDVRRFPSAGPGAGQR